MAQGVRSRRRGRSRSEGGFVFLQLPHVAQHLVDDCGLCDDREHPHLPAASRAGEGIDFEDHLTEGNAQPQEPRPARAGLREQGLVLLRELPDRDLARLVTVAPTRAVCVGPVVANLPSRARPVGTLKSLWCLGFEHDETGKRRPA